MEMLNLKKGVSLDLHKGDILNLNKGPDFSSLNHLHVGLGWQTKTDLDSMAFLKDQNNKIQETVYFGSMNHQGIRLMGDNLVGNRNYQEADDEVILIDLNSLPNYVRKIDICANIYAADVKLFGIKDFSKVKNAFVRLVDEDTGCELCRYNLSEYGKGFNAFHLGSLILQDGFWQFVAVGRGLNGSVSKLATVLDNE